MPVVYHCPHCQQPVSVPDNMLGQAIGCPHCRNPFQTFPPAPAAPAPVPAPLPPPPPPAKAFSLDDEEPQPKKGAFEELDAPRRRRRSRNQTPRYHARSGGRSGGRYQRGRQKMPLSQLFGMIGGIAAGVGVMVVNMNNRRPGKGFDAQEILISAVVGGAGAGLGFLIGKIIEWQAEAQQQRRHRDEDEDEDED